MHVDYEYHGLMAETWDLLRGDPSGRFDGDFYLEMICQYGEPVLDLGCGTGRLLLDFLELGIDIEGVDVSPEMLSLCRDKAALRNLSPCLYQQSLYNLSLPRHYRTILASSSVLQLIPDPLAVRQALMCINTHVMAGGALLQRMGRVWYNPFDECEHTEDLYQIQIEGDVVAVEHHRRSPASRSYIQAQARTLFEQAGFTCIEVTRGFSHQHASDEDCLFVVVGLRER